MVIDFPNRCRSYDTTRRAVRFWGYSRCMESSFYVTVDALKQISRKGSKPASPLQYEMLANVADGSMPLIKSAIRGLRLLI